ncbi:MAG TPA: aminotransferase class III-fold pyridoxal phosphate-dependent enzyme, partial [Candidatus Eremiobacteraeota bacterium]|nr:aminotransferase class III-fold pyridoxal phosphate-dependent enzyme [Candidatus Eremiobacteraeota bacterium]
MVLTQNLTKKYIEEAEEYVANIYHPLPVVLSKGEGVWVWDIEGRKFLDMLSAYSALNQGHRHPRIIQALKDQLEKITLTSRAFHNDIMGKFLEKLCKLTGKEKVLPMNTGAEAVETAIKAARKWGYLRKKVEENKAEIIVLENNFHGRTTMIVGFSSDEQYRYGFGPFPEGFKIIPYDSAEALEKSITSNTVGFLFEPIQGEGGVIIPHEGYLQKTYEICKKHNV